MHSRENECQNLDIRFRSACFGASARFLSVIGFVEGLEAPQRRAHEQRRGIGPGQTQSNDAYVVI